MRSARILILAAALVAFLCGPGHARTLQVYTTVMEPFVMDNGGELSGFYIDLWQEVARTAHLDYQMHLAPTDKDLLKYLSTGRADVGFSGVPMVYVPDSGIEYSYSTNHSGLQIMVPKNNTPPMTSIMATAGSIIFSAFTLYVAGLIIAIGFICANILWFLERRKHNPQFQKGWARGMLIGVWWAVETITSVGFGDCTLKSRAARIFGTLFMIVGTCLFAAMASVITTKLTLHHMQPLLSDPRDLSGQRVVLMSSTTYAGYLQSLGAEVIPASSTRQAIRYLNENKADCVVGDYQALHRFVLGRGRNDFQLVGPIFHRQDFAFGLPKDSPYLDAINEALLKLKSNGQYQSIYLKWFGPTS